MKLITVVIPNYNCQDYLDRCIESIVSQTYVDLEILICDNGSEDDSVSVINKWAQKDARIKVLINEKNQGLVNCYNRLFFAATGEYIVIMDADDWSDVTRVEKQAAVLDEHHVGICISNAVFHKHFGAPQFTPHGGSRLINKNSDEVWASAPATMMFRRDALQQVKGYNTYFHMLSAYDVYFVMSMLDAYGGYYLDEPLYHVWARPLSDHRSLDVNEPNFLRKAISGDIYRFLRKQRIETGTDWLKENNMTEVKKLENEKLNDKSYMSEKLRAIACIQIDYGSYKNAWLLLLEAFKKAPFYLENYRSLLYLLKSKYSNKKNYKELTKDKIAPQRVNV
ncbi:MAG TPA: glycosyltransferase family A protein [Flavipsychrobacter sp.]|nr:glycosyltransferase family A protein [Flavipsychrobacter sp.]